MKTSCKIPLLIVTKTGTNHSRAFGGLWLATLAVNNGKLLTDKAQLTHFLERLCIHSW